MRAAANEPRAGGPRPSAALLAAAGAALIAVLLAVAAPDIGPWGDGLGILAAIGDTSGANPRAYHVGYALLARAAVSIGAAVGLAPEPAVLTLSRVALVLGAVLCVRVATGLGARPVAALGWTAVALASPSLWFFGGAVEVHAVQFLGSAAALALVVRARRSDRIVVRGALALVAATLALALHLSHLLLLPALFVFAIAERDDAATRDGRRAGREFAGLAVLAAIGAAAAIGCFAWFRSLSPEAGVPGGIARPAYYLGQYEALFVDFKSRFGWFGPVGMARHFAAEGLGQGGFVWLAAAVALVFARGRTRVALLLVTVTYVLVVSQAGLRERGGYYVSAMPWFVAFAAATTAGRGPGWRALGWFVLPLQLALGWNALATYAERPDARSWSRWVVDVVEVPCTVFTSDMVRLSALPLERDGIDGLQWNQQFEYTPRADWDRALRVPYEQALVGALATGRVYLDADIVAWDRPLHERAAWQRWANDLLDRPDVALEPVESADGRPLLLELVVTGE